MLTEDEIDSLCRKIGATKVLKLELLNEHCQVPQSVLKMYTGPDIKSIIFLYRLEKVLYKKKPHSNEYYKKNSYNSQPADTSLTQYITSLGFTKIAAADYASTIETFDFVWHRSIIGWILFMVECDLM